MDKAAIGVRINERSQTVPAGLSAGQVRDLFKPNADLIIINGFPANPGVPVREGDGLILIRRGEIPDAAEMEAIMAARHSPGVHRRMKSATVGIGGLGGLGSNVAVALARMGIGAMILVDFDVVEPSNLNRQQYFLSHIGMAKTEAMRRILLDVNPHIRVITHNEALREENIPVFFKEVEIIVECLDRAEAKALFIQTAAASFPDRYIIGASGLAGYGDGNSILTRKVGERVFMVGDWQSAATVGQGLMAPRVGIAAHHQANLVVRLLMGDV